MSLKKVLNVDCPYKEVECESESCSCYKYTAWRNANNEQKLEEFITSLDCDYHCDDTLKILMAIEKEKLNSFIFNEDNTLITDKIISDFITHIEMNISNVRKHLNYFFHCNIITNNKELIKDLFNLFISIIDLYVISEYSFDEIKKLYFLTYSENIIDVYDIIKYAYEKQSTNKRLSCIENVSEIVDAIKTNDLFSEEEEKENNSSFNTHNINMLILLTYLSDCCSNIRNAIHWESYKEQENTKNTPCFEVLLHDIINIFISIGYNSNMLTLDLIKIGAEQLLREQYKNEI
jgi:hypothetical protein